MYVDLSLLAGGTLSSDHLLGFSCDVSRHSFISSAVVAGLVLVVITLGVFPPAVTHKNT